MLKNKISKTHYHSAQDIDLQLLQSLSLVKAALTVGVEHISVSVYKFLLV